VPCLSAISNALKQGNLSPELEEKLVSMQKQQENANSTCTDEWELCSRGTANNEVLAPNCRSFSSRDHNTDDVEWKIRPSLKRNAMTTSSQFNRNLKKCRRQNEEVAELGEQKQSQLERHKELLKKSILRKRSLLERNLQNEIHEDVQTKVQRHVRPLSVASPEEHSENERSGEQNMDLKRYALKLAIQAI